MKIGGVPKLVSFLTKAFTFSSFSHYLQKHLVFFPKFTYEPTPNYYLVMFLALSLLIVAIFFQSSSKPSSGGGQDSQYHSSSFLSSLELYPLSCKFDEEIPHETYSLANIVDEDYQEFVPRLVHLELIEGATGSHEGYKDSIPRLVHVELIEGATGSDEESFDFHGYDGYDEDNDDEGGEDDAHSTEDEDDNNDHDLKRRIEEFIAKNIGKWKEEMLHDKFLYLEY